MGITEMMEPFAVLSKANDLEIEVDQKGWLTGSEMILMLRKEDRTLMMSPGKVGFRVGDSSPYECSAVMSHYTCTRGVGAWKMAKRIAGNGSGRAASWHAIIDRTGMIVQSASLYDRTWHAGSPTVAKYVRDSRGVWIKKMKSGISPNGFAFGIELENVGKVKYMDGQWLGWPFHKNDDTKKPVIVPTAEVEVSSTRKDIGWHMYTLEQKVSWYAVVSAIRKDLCSRGVAIPLENFGFSHSDVDPTRREDPGPLWERYLRLLGFRKGGPEGATVMIPGEIVVPSAKLK